MKKQLLFTVLLGLLISGAVIAKDNLLKNPSFELPGTGKYRADCQADGCFNGKVLNWFFPAGCTDSGVEHDYGSTDGIWVGYAHNMDGHCFQVVDGKIDATNRKYSLSYIARTSWSNPPATGDLNDIYIVSYYYSFSGTDTVNKVKLDSLATKDVGWKSSTDRDTSWIEITHNFTVPTAQVGKRLVIAFDIITTNDAPGTVWEHFDLFNLSVAAAPTEINSNEINQSLVDIFPNPSSGIVNLKARANTSVKVINTLGELVKTVKLESSSASVDMSDLAKGLYFINASSGNSVSTQKLILK
jgi:hypothetical protein